MENLTHINGAQYELINMLSCVTTDKDMKDLKDVIVQFLNSRLQNEIESLWQDGTLTQEKVSAWANEHMRTPY